MTQASAIPGLDRFLFTLSVVERELRHLEYSRERVFTEPIDAAWVECLDSDPEQAERWLEARALRNRLVHEYMDDPRQFAVDLSWVESYVDMLFATYEHIRVHARERMHIPPDRLPPTVPRTRDGS